MSYKIIYQNGEHEMLGFATVASAINEASSWGEEQVAITSGSSDSDKIVESETGRVVCFLADKYRLLERHSIEAGDDFFDHIECIGTYSDAEVLTLK